MFGCWTWDASFDSLRNMPRAMRVEYPGASYHVMDRGGRREDIFVDDVDRQDFLKTLAEACHKTGWQMQAYCLMRNHFHWVVETPNPNLVEGINENATYRRSHGQSPVQQSRISPATNQTRAALT